MIKKGETVTCRDTNGWGNISVTLRDRYIVTADDVNSKRDNYRGFKHSSHVFKRADIGREIEVIRDQKDADYISWYFITDSAVRYDSFQAALDSGDYDSYGVLAGQIIAKDAELGFIQLGGAS